MTSDSQSKPSNGPSSPLPEDKPRPRTLAFEPEYAIEAGVSHEYNGILYVPTEGEFARCAEERRAEELAPRVLPVAIGMRPVTKDNRVKMSAGELIRLGATKSK